MIERGDVKVLKECRGRNIVSWAPSDPNSLTRLASSMLRSSDDDIPASVLMIAPLPFIPGASDVTNFLDIWWHPLRGEKFSPLMRARE